MSSFVNKHDIEVIKHGVVLPENYYYFNPQTKVFTCDDDEIVIKTNRENITYIIKNNCTLFIGSYSNINCGNECYIHSGNYCEFNAGNECTFKTSNNCEFHTGNNCIFKTGSVCTFNTGDECEFDSGYGCVFNVGVDANIECFESNIYYLNTGMFIRTKNTAPYNNKTKVYDVDYDYGDGIEGFEATEVELDRLAYFPLENPRLLMLHVKDPLGKRLFEHYKKKGLL